MVGPESDGRRAERAAHEPRYESAATGICAAGAIRFYADANQTKPMTTIAAWQAFSQRTPVAARIWLERLAAIEPAGWSEIMQRIAPQRMTQIAREFTSALLAA